MTILQGQTTSFKYQLYLGQHNFNSNIFYIALYTGNASLNQSTTAYTTSGEIVGAGYTAGGQMLTGVTVNFDNNTSTAYIDFSSISWNNSSFIARCALIYNVSNSNSSVAVIDFGADKSTSNGIFTITMPVNAPTTALIRSS